MTDTGQVCRYITFYDNGEIRVARSNFNGRMIPLSADISKDKFEAVFHLYYKT